MNHFFTSILVIVATTIINSCQKLDFRGVTKCSVEEITFKSLSSVKVKINVIDLSPSIHNNYGVCFSKENKTPSIVDSVVTMGEILNPETLTKTIENLELGSTYYFRAFVMDDGKPVYSFNIKEYKTGSLPVSNTLPATSINACTAILNGHVRPNNIYTNIGFQYGETPDLGQTVIANPHTIEIDASFVSNKVTGLLPNTKYYFRVISTCIYGTTYGDTISFTTTSPGVPESLTNTPFEITTTSVKIECQIISDGGSEILERGICWSSSPDPTVSDFKIDYGKGHGSFIGILEGLNPSSTYYVRAYAINNIGIGYGNEVSFITSINALPEVTTMPVSITGLSNINSGGEVLSQGDYPVTERGVCWGVEPNPTIMSNKIAERSGSGIFYVSLSGLNSSETYYIRAYATNNSGTSYGEEYHFKTINNGGTWTKLTDHPRGGFYYIQSFAIENEIYFTNAVASGNASYMNELWKYNVITNTWNRLTDFPGTQRVGSSYFSINGKGFVCLGDIGTLGKTLELWEYDPDNDTWTRKADFPGPGRTSAFCFVLNNKAYIGGGNTVNNVEFSDVYCYDPEKNLWEKKSDFTGGKVMSATSFILNKRAFVVGGIKANKEYKGLWLYDEKNDTWISKADFPGSETQSLNSFAVNGYGIAGLGSILTAIGATSQLYSYNYYLNLWTRIDDFPGQIRMTSLCGFVNGKAFYGFGNYSMFGNFSDLWMYTP